MDNRKMFKSGDHFASQISQLVENRKSTGKIPAAVLNCQQQNDYYNRRVFTETVENDDQFQIEKAMKKFAFNFNNNKSKVVTKSGVKKPQGLIPSNSKQKNIYTMGLKMPKTNFLISTNNIHQNINIFTEEAPKKKQTSSKIMLTQGSVKDVKDILSQVKSKEKLLKKDSKKILTIVKKEKKSTANKQEIKLNKSKDYKQKNSEPVIKERVLKTQVGEEIQVKIPEIQIIQKIGQGTFGQVYKAKIAGNKIVAIKKVFQDKKYKNRELQILKMLNNDFVLKVLFTFYTRQKAKSPNQQDKQYLNVVMQYFEKNLYQINNETKKLLPDIDVKIYMYQLFRGLSYIHSLQICHRDIKPANILINKKNNKLVICDFGSAKKLVKNEPNIAYICSRCYRAPQLIFGSVQYTTMIDIWSAGCVLLQLLKGEPFFIGDSNVDQLVQIIKILGTPSKTEVINMNPSYDLDDYKFPKIKVKEWKTIFPKADEKLISLIKQLMIYSPKQRLNACETIAHEYFDELRQEARYKQLIAKKNIPCLFDFTKQELKGNEHLTPKLIPSWFKSKKIEK